MKFLDHPDPEIRVTAERDGDRVWFSVTDNGPGIPRGQQERVFQPFVRLDPERTNLRLGTRLGAPRPVSSRTHTRATLRTDRCGFEVMVREDDLGEAMVVRCLQHTDALVANQRTCGNLVSEISPSLNGA